jgi:general secretion pathway protein J
MSAPPQTRSKGFTLIELLVALLILSSLALMSYRGLGAVLDARAHVSAETVKWRRLAAFMARFERDILLAVPRPARAGSGMKPVWRGLRDPMPGLMPAPLLEFSRAASAEGMDRPRRTGYGLNDRQEIELWLWPGLDLVADTQPARHTVLEHVTAFELKYLNSELAWVDAWPGPEREPAFPRAVRLRIVLASGEEIMRVFALN